MDSYLIEYLNGSVLTLAALNVIIKACARISPWQWDDALSDAIDEVLGMLFPRGREKK